MIHLYKIPGFYIAGFFGGFGSGKSLALLEHGLDLANYYKCRLATSFRVRPKNIKRYCRKYKLDWFAKFGRIFYRPNIDDLFNCERCVLLFDEVGSSELFSRNFRNNSLSEVLRDKTFRIRHYHNKLLFASQQTGQVDKQLRNNCQLFVWCRGFSVNYKMFTRSQYFFNPIAFEGFQEEYQNKFLYPIWKSGFRWETRIVGLKEKYLFSCYDSFDRPYANKYTPSKVLVTGDPMFDSYQVRDVSYGSEIALADKLDGLDVTDNLNGLDISGADHELWLMPDDSSAVVDDQRFWCF